MSADLHQTTASSLTRAAYRFRGAKATLQSAVLLAALAVLSCDRRGYTPLVKAVLQDDIAEVRQLLRAGEDANACVGGPGWTTSPLVAAAGLDRFEIVEALLASGADVDRVCLETPLQRAATNGSVRAIKALVRHGADINRRTTGGGTYLMSAVWGAQPDAIPVLVAAGCQVDATTADTGETALMQAAGSDANSTKALLEAGADVNIRDKQGDTALIHAMRGAKNSSPETSPGKWEPRIVDMLLQAGADPHIRDSSGKDMMSLATETGRFRNDIESILRRAGAK